MKNSINEIVGWYGAGAIVLAYALVSNSLVSSTGLVCQLLNLSGALGLFGFLTEGRFISLSRLILFGRSLQLSQF